MTKKQFWFWSKVTPYNFSELRSDRYYKHRTNDYNSLKNAIIEKAQEDWLEKQLFNQKKHILQPLTDVSTEKSAKPPEKEKSVKENFPSGHPQTFSGEKGKGKGKGKGATPKPRNVRPIVETQPPRFAATIYCKWCKKKGHYEEKCWSKEKWEKSQKKSLKMPKYL